MRARNIKVNVFLNKTEKKILEEKSSKMKLSQSEFIRNLIDDFKINFLSNSDINYIAESLEESINELLKLKKRFHNFGYFEDEEFLKNKMIDFDFWISRLKK
ncbi:MAG: hypothetical protein HFJ38_02655 [Bacilli bacterium]|nr:hypothetical protein [Bacilli bacterium]